MNKEKCLVELGEIIAEGHHLVFAYTPLGQLGPRLVPGSEQPPAWRVRAFLVRAAHAAETIGGGRESQFYRQLVLRHEPQPRDVDAALGAMVALRHAVAGDHLQSLRQFARAEVFVDFLSQARELVESGYHVAAAVIIGGVLEERLRDECRRRDRRPKGMPGIGAYIPALKDVLSAPVQKRLQAIAATRNLAAHGEGAKVDPAEVEEALPYVERLQIG
jgi:hypothetical protein